MGRDPSFSSVTCKTEAFTCVKDLFKLQQTNISYGSAISLGNYMGNTECDYVDRFVTCSATEKFPFSKLLKMQCYQASK